MLKKAVALHQKGQLAEAAALYRKILRQDPRNADALHLLGVIETQRKNSLAAIELFDRAIAVSPQNPAFYSNRGTALTELKRLDEALVSFNRALAIKPDYAEALNNRGSVLRDLKRVDEALKSFNRALAVKPDYAEALYNRGNTLADLKRLDEALVSYARALAIKPDYAEALYNRGVALKDLKRLDEALASFSRALAIKPDYAEALNNRGIVLKDLERADEALASFSRALAIAPDYADAPNNHGNALTDLRRFEEAVASYDRALALKPEYAEALNNRGNALTALNRLDDALASYDRALAARPGYADALCNRGLAQLLGGNYRKGLEGCEWRWETNGFSSKPPNIGAPRWQGEDIAGRTILVFSEQGLGDQIQFTRYLPLLIQRGAKVTYFCPAQLVRLLRPLDAQIAFVSSLSGDETFDFQCALMSLPLRFGTELDSIPSRIPYLEAQVDLAGAWKQRIGEAGFKIGISWQGNPVGKIDRGRSFPLSELSPLARRPGIRLISLQKNHGLDQLMKLPADAPVETLGDGFDSGPDAFIDTAAVMSNLDLIMTSDTSIAHLAGALGRPTWVALQHVPDWRWLLDREDSPWYPTVRLFRQQTRDDWSTVFRNMAEELDAILSRNCHANAAGPRM